MLNVARLFQSLDDDKKPKNGIRITENALACLNKAAVDMSLTSLDFGDTDTVENLIHKTCENCGDSLEAASMEDAKAHLEEQLSSAMFRKNISKTPEVGTTKSKLDLVPVLVPATMARPGSV